ncbi:MAG: hypothetical protein IPO92_04705 [Saprospiraceae bacterium]|nr:hypothetical protein [Saprospiraceae bacterium]
MKFISLILLSFTLTGVAYSQNIVFRGHHIQKSLVNGFVVDFNLDGDI